MLIFAMSVAIRSARDCASAVPSWRFFYRKIECHDSDDEHNDYDDRVAAHVIPLGLATSSQGDAPQCKQHHAPQSVAIGTGLSAGMSKGMPIGSTRCIARQTVDRYAGCSGLCEAAGFEEVKTYITSGNVDFRSECQEDQVRSVLEVQLRGYSGRDVGVLVRTGNEIADTVARNPFADAQGNRVMALFVDGVPSVIRSKA